MKWVAAVVVVLGVFLPATVDAETYPMDVGGGGFGVRGPLDMGLPCTWSSDCEEGVCVLSGPGGLCSRWCVDECPPHWTCQSVATEDPAVVNIACVLDGLTGTLAPDRPGSIPEPMAEAEPGANDIAEGAPTATPENAHEGAVVVADTVSDSAAGTSRDGVSDSAHHSVRPAPTGGCTAAASASPSVYVTAFAMLLLVAWVRVRPFELGRHRRRAFVTLRSNDL